MPERGSEPARYEDRLRERKVLHLADVPHPFAVLLPEERDALADAVEALREFEGRATEALGEPGDQEYLDWARIHARSALARLDGLGG